MSTAGRSARHEAARSSARADALRRELADEEERTRNFMVAAETERKTAIALAPLAAAGFHLLADRRWPKSRSAQVDLVVVGPSGVWIVDTKAWREMTIAAGRVYRGDDDVTEAFENLHSLAETTREALVEVGLAPAEVHSVVVWSGRDRVDHRFDGVEIVGTRNALTHITRPGRRLNDAAIDAALLTLLDLFRPLSAPAPVNITLAQPVLDAESQELDIAELPTETEVRSAILDSLMAAPVEEWMTFLHPDQARLIRRSFAGPSRIRGAAGTGKTVVGLHRAAHLARANPEGRVLVTTYVRTLPTVLRELLARLAPDAVDRVDFVGVHEFARSVLDERGVRIRVRDHDAGDALRAAWHSDAGRAVAAIEDNLDYWREEIESVIKGRGFDDFETYDTCPRPGRRRRLGTVQRRAVWAFFSDYERRLRAAGINDHADVILLAEAELAREPLTRYTAVIVDEAQDLSLAMIRLLHSLVGDRPDAFTLIGDGQQSIYPGGFTLAEAGISVASRGVVLDINYRNTAEIIERAETIVAGDQVTDIEGDGPGATARRPEPLRRGEAPVAQVFTSRGAHDRAMVARIRSVTESVDTGIGDVAVLCASNRDVERATLVLAAAGIPTVSLLDYSGRETHAVKIGTISRGKGLEFKQVLLPWTRRSLLDPGSGPRNGIADSMLEREARDRRVLFVGMTRARDGLWVGSIG